MKRLLLFFFCFLPCFTIIGQSISPKFIPPSPDQYWLGKFIETPVSIYNGTPDIQIPIYELNEGTISVPISLSYNASGIKVDEVASWVGLGWSLFAGGSITRVVKGKAEYLYSNGTTTSLRPERSNQAFYIPTATSTSMDFVASSDLEVLYYGGKDPEPDIFYYNFAGRSGKFYLDNSGKAVFEKYEGIEIKLEYVSISAFNIIAILDNGDIYTFADRETTIYSGESQPVVSGWLLSKIETPQKDQITFEYQYFGTISHDIRVESEYTLNLKPTNPTITTTGMPSMGVNYEELKIARISSSNGYVQFIADNTMGRKDCRPNTYPLKEILLYRSNGSLIKRWKLSTSYFEANDSRKYNGFSPQAFTFLNFRLRLDSLQEIDNTQTPKSPPYRFIYFGDNNPTTDDPYTLPYRLSPSQDHWGYYNMAANSHMFPTRGWNQYLSAEYIDQWYYFFYAYTSSGWSGGNNPVPGANREANSEATKANTIKEIVYPSGGKTIYDYGINDCDMQGGDASPYGNGLRIETITHYPTAGNVQITRYSYEGTATRFEPWTYYKKLVAKNTPNAGTTPGGNILAFFGIPISEIEMVNHSNFLKIYAEPRSVLSGLSERGYANVTVTQIGNGKTIYRYGQRFENDDHIRRDNEVNLLQDLYKSQYVAGYPWTGYPKGIFEEKSLNYNDWPFPEYYSNSWRRGLIKQKQVYSENNTLLSQDDYEYSTPTLNAVPGFKVIRENPNGDYIFAKYFLPCGWVGILKHTATVRDETGTLLQNITEYFYENDKHRNVTRTEITRSDGSKVIDYTTYALDYALGTPFLDNMNVSHLQNLPIEQVTAISKAGNLNITSGKITLYQTEAKGLKSAEMVLEISSPLQLNMFKFSNKSVGVTPGTSPFQSFNADSKYKTQIYYDNYNPSNKLNQYHSSNDANHSYQWGYNNSYPVVQIVNAENSLNTTTSVNTAYGSLNMPSNSASTSFTTTTAGNIVLTAMSNPGSTYTISYTLSGAANRSGILCASRSSTSCSYPETTTLTGMPAGAYTLSITLYSGSSEYKGINYTYQTTQTVTTGIKEFFFESFEENLSANAVTGTSHSGSKYWNTNYTTSYTKPNSRNYVIQWWNLSGGKWIFNQQPFTSNITLTGPVDDIRIFPVDAQITTYTYEPLIGMTSQTDPGGKTITYEYDSFGRLIQLRDQDKNIIKKICYNYTGQPESCTLYSNVAKSGTFTRNNCSAGYTGSSVTYTVPAGTYTSSTQAAADQLALDDVAANGQAYANANGTCTQSCSFSAYTGYGITASGISKSGSVTTFYIVFNSLSGNTNWYAINRVATINGSCKPNSTTTFTMTETDRTWNVIINSTGAFSVQLLGGTPPSGTSYIALTGGSFTP